ncbi:MAG: glycosyltransferase [Cyclobacteriaceae bacterium]|nr:glycosyltransferase [Cyclobacteriaceae bacterium]
MSAYGNIFNLYNHTEQQLEAVKSVLSNMHLNYEVVEKTFFIETTSKKNTRELIKEFKALNVNFMLFHNHISDGSKLSSNGFLLDKIIRIKKILF